jgi:hypothetical protein
MRHGRRARGGPYGLARRRLSDDRRGGPRGASFSPTSAVS